MPSKVYVVLAFLMHVFLLYYQFFLVQRYSYLDILQALIQSGLVVGAFSFYFQRKFLEAKYWKIFFKVLVANLGLNLILQLMPNSYRGDFSFLNNGLLINVFVYLFILCLFFPLYLGVYNLGYSKKPKNTKKK